MYFRIRARRRVFQISLTISRNELVRAFPVFRRGRTPAGPFAPVRRIIFFLGPSNSPASRTRHQPELPWQSLRKRSCNTCPWSKVHFARCPPRTATLPPFRAGRKTPELNHAFRSAKIAEKGRDKHPVYLSAHVIAMFSILSVYPVFRRYTPAMQRRFAVQPERFLFGH